MSTLPLAVYTHVVPATDHHGTTVVARMGDRRASVPYPHELSDWADIHAKALLALLEKTRHPMPCEWCPALYGEGVIWVCTSETQYRFDYTA